MNLSSLLSAIRQQPAYARAVAAAQADYFPINLDLPRAARTPALAALATDLRRPLLVLTARNDHALTLLDELTAWQPALCTLHFAEPNTLFYERAAWGPRTRQQRFAALAALLEADRRAALAVAADDDATDAGATQPPVVITTARSLLTRTLPPQTFQASASTLRVGQTVRLEKMLAGWQAAGYQGQTVVVEPGQFSRRGGIVDVWSPTDSYPVRVELFGDEIESLRRFDPTSQRSGDGVGAVTVAPAREALPGGGPELVAQFRRPKSTDFGRHQEMSDSPLTELEADLELLATGATFPHLEYYLPWLHPEPATLLDYLPRNAIVIADDWQAFEDSVREFEEQALQLRAEQEDAGLLPNDAPAPHVSWSDLQDQLASARLLCLGGASLPISPAADPPAALQLRSGQGSGQALGAAFAPERRWGGQIKPLLDYLAELRLTDQRMVVVTRQAARLAELWSEYDAYLAPVESLDELPEPGALTFVQGALAAGWTLASSAPSAPSADLHLLTDAELFGWSRPEPRHRRRSRPAAGTTPEDAFVEFRSGELVVHIEHGIGRYRQLVKRTIGGTEREYLHIEYAGGDNLFVPINQADRLTRYVGADGHLPALSRLGTAEWSRVREHTRQAVEEVARELLDLYARRETTIGHAFSPDGAWQRELEAAFPYVETEDQMKALAEVKADMERSRPMDRLICGDVGYGKTEVALRAAFKAVMDGKQVAVLVPTTVLAQQHFDTFLARLAAYPVRVEMLSRFRTRGHQQQILTGLVAGQVDIVIGTHRLVQKDVQFKDLGLVIIDEEQRFGVTHKEHLKKLRTAVDVLTLTATPIPRTLYMSLTGARDISTINTAPDERLPVVTKVGPFNRREIRQAVLRELDRGGQVFYVHNRVQTIQAARKQLATIVPEARLGVAHGQMPERQLENVMHAFTHGEMDVLVCTSIIESGLDIPNANTLIVDRADMFGLAQLYQLRGRVGRGGNRAYAYLFYQSQGQLRRITPEARQRLDTIAEQTELGAGYGIAMRDLEIRGTGDILGMRQHGHISAVGFHLYTRLLRQAVQNLKSGAPLRPESQPKPDLALVSVDLPLDATLPAEYIADQSLRLRLYRRLAEVETESAVDDLAAELADRFGTLPTAVENLLYQMRVKLRAHRARIEGVGYESGALTLRKRAWEMKAARARLAAYLPRRARISKGKVWLPRTVEEGAWQRELLETLDALATEA